MLVSIKLFEFVRRKWKISFHRCIKPEKRRSKNWIVKFFRWLLHRVLFSLFAGFSLLFSICQIDDLLVLQLPINSKWRCLLNVWRWIAMFNEIKGKKVFAIVKFCEARRTLWKDMEKWRKREKQNEREKCMKRFWMTRSGIKWQLIWCSFRLTQSTTKKNDNNGARAISGNRKGKERMKTTK